jgi:hypothetical protein
MFQRPEVEGKILLKAHPNAGALANGARIRVIADPLPELYQRMPVYTANFILAP